MRTGSAPMPLMPSAVASRLRGVDGEHQDALVLRCRDRQPECRAHRGLADAAATGADHHFERCQLVPEPGRFLANAPAAFGDACGHFRTHASLLLSASATARVVVRPVRSTMSGTGTTGIGSLLRSWRV